MRCVTGGTVITESGEMRATVAIEGGRVAALLAPDAPLPAGDRIDASGLLVFPGGIDAHTHLNEPGYEASEDFASGTAGALAGGCTTVIEMPQTVPLVTDAASLRAKRAACAPHAHCDYAFWAALVPANHDRPDELAALAQAGAIGLKAFVSWSSEVPRCDASQLLRGMVHARRLGLPVAVHCETQAFIDERTEALRAARRTDVLAALDSRPPAAEIDAVSTVVRLARASGARVHLVHLSRPESVQLAAAARADGVDVSAETCPQYLTLTRDAVATHGPWAVCQPPLQDADARERLWRLLAADAIDIVASDHCAYLPEEKHVADPLAVAAGITGIQLNLPLLVDGARARGIRLARVAAVLAGNPARRLGLWPRKGSLLPGADADLVLVDPDAPRRVRVADWFTRSGGTAYEGLEARPRVVRALVRGETHLVDDGTPRLLSSPGAGRELPRER